MCTIKMTFQVPDSKHIDVEALKTQVNNFVGYLISVPGIVWQESNEKDEEGLDASPELLGRLAKARQEIREGNCVTLRSKDEIDAYFDSL